MVRPKGEEGGVGDAVDAGKVYNGSEHIKAWVWFA